MATSADFFFTIDKPSFAEFKDRGSKFIAYVYPMDSVETFKAHLQQLKKEHPKAAHHCFAYRLDTDGNNFRSSDDGEPSGSAGKPILGQIDSKGLTNTAIIVVRYFGGTLLGVPGLINAYKTSASLALQLTAVIQKPVLITYELHFDYTLMNDVMMVVKRFGLIVMENEMQLFCRMVIGIPKDNLELTLDKLKDMHGLELRQVQPA